MGKDYDFEYFMNVGKYILFVQSCLDLRYGNTAKCCCLPTNRCLRKYYYQFAIDKSLVMLCDDLKWKTTTFILKKICKKMI